MRIPPVIVSVAAVCLAAAAHADEQKSAIAIQKEMIACTAKINEQLTGITSSATADKAAAQIKLLGPDYAKLIEQREKAVEPSSPEEQKEMEELVEKNTEAFKEFDANMKRIMQNQWMTLNLAFALRTMNPKPPEPGKLVPVHRETAKPKS